MKHKKEIDEIMFKLVWEYRNSTSVCKGCGVYKYTGKPHADDCAYGELLRIIEEAKK